MHILMELLVTFVKHDFKSKSEDISDSYFMLSEWIERISVCLSSLRSGEEFMAVSL